MAIKPMYTQEHIDRLSKCADLMEEQIAGKQEYYDTRSEKWQESDQASEYQEKLDTMQECHDELMNIIDKMTELLSQ